MGPSGHGRCSYDASPPFVYSKVRFEATASTIPASELYRRISKIYENGRSRKTRSGASGHLSSGLAQCRSGETSSRQRRPSALYLSPPFGVKQGLVRRRPAPEHAKTQRRHPRLALYPGSSNASSHLRPVQPECQNPSISGRKVLRPHPSSFQAQNQRLAVLAQCERRRG
jgi:hypothetical protein